MSKIKIEDIQQQCKEHNWLLISDTYSNLKAEMIFECSENHRIYSSWDKIRNKWECPHCKKNTYKELDTNIVPKKKGTYRVFGLDQSTKNTGWSIYDDKMLTKYGLFETTYESETDRIHAVKMWFVNMILNWKPDYIGIEDIQLQKGKTEGGEGIMNTLTFKVLAKLQGVLIETALEMGVPLVVISSNTWRKHIGVKGKSRADRKRSAQLIIKELYDISVSDDIAEGILIGKYVSDTKSKQFIMETWE